MVKRGTRPEKETTGVVCAVSKQWWLKINTKPVRLHALDGAVFPHIIKVQYEAEGGRYVKRKWIRAGCPVPETGSDVSVFYQEGNPRKARIL